MTLPRPLLLSLALLVAACSEEIRSDVDAGSREPVRLPAAPEPSVENGFSTHLYSERDAEVFSRVLDSEGVPGLTVEAILVELGDDVTAGEVLARLDDEAARLRVQAIRPAVAEAAATLERVRALEGSGIVTTAELESAQFEYERAKAALDRAELNLARTEVRSPFAGVVARRFVSVGQLVGHDEPLFRVTANEELRARLRISEERAEWFETGTAVVVKAGDGREAAGSVLLVGPTVDPASGTREVVVAVPEPGGLTAGSAVTVSLAGGGMDGR